MNFRKNWDTFLPEERNFSDILSLNSEEIEVQSFRTERILEVDCDRYETKFHGHFLSMSEKIVFTYSQNRNDTLSQTSGRATADPMIRLKLSVGI